MELLVEEEIRAVPVRVRSAYRPELDILRFFSFFSVFCLHTLVPPINQLSRLPYWLAKSYVSLISAGGFGVDLFFLLSAYLITDLLLREKSHFGSLDIKAFYVRRLLRIWPLYFVFIGAVALIPFLDFDGGRAFPLRYVAAFLLFSGNWACTVWGWPLSVLAPLWSVSIEEQFYLLWPPIVAKLSRERIAWAAVGMIVFANLYRALEISLFHHSAIKMWGNTFAHLDSLAAGILIASLLNGKALKFGLLSRLTMVAVALFCFALRAGLVGDPEQHQSLFAIAEYPLVPFACCLMLLAFLGLNWRSSGLEYLGKISYGLYAYHMMMLHISDKIVAPLGHGALHAGGRVACGFMLTLVISALSYELMEKPFLKLKKRFTLVESRPA